MYAPGQRPERPLGCATPSSPTRGPQVTTGAVSGEPVSTLRMKAINGLTASSRSIQRLRSESAHVRTAVFSRRGKRLTSFPPIIPLLAARVRIGSESVLL